MDVPHTIQSSISFLFLGGFCENCCEPKHIEMGQFKFLQNQKKKKLLIWESKQLHVSYNWQVV